MVKELLKFIWIHNIKEDFLQGKLIYERQLQAALYYYLRANLPSNYTTWVEPTAYFTTPIQNKLIEKSKPDIVITDDNEGTVIAIIELKFQPWDDVHYKEDIQKLVNFEMECMTGNSLRLGWIPRHSAWKKQEVFKESEMRYSLNTGTLLCFFSGAKRGSEALKKITSVDFTNRFIHLVGFISKDQTKDNDCMVYFEVPKENYDQSI